LSHRPKGYIAQRGLSALRGDGTTRRLYRQGLRSIIRANVDADGRIHFSNCVGYWNAALFAQGYVVCGELKAIHLLARPDWNSAILETLGASNKLSYCPRNSWVLGSCPNSNQQRRLL